MITEWKRVDAGCEERVAGGLRLEIRMMAEGWGQGWQAVVLLRQGRGAMPMLHGQIRPRPEDAKDEAERLASQWARDIMQALGARW